jgi:hypothetical protein
MRKLLMLLTALLVLACNNEGEYSTWPCRFAYDNSLHLDANLSSAMNTNSRGVFCKIWESSLGGRALNFQNNQGLQTTSQPETALEKEANFVLGINNGIIVGFQTFNDYPNGGFVAYDVQCPNCVRRENNTVNPKYPVTMGGDGIATCSKCGKKYDLNNGGMIQNGEEGDRGLEKYLATCTGPNGFISVGTKR